MGSLSGKRPADGDPDKWISPKRTAIASKYKPKEAPVATTNRFGHLTSHENLDANTPEAVTTRKNSRIPPIIINIKPDWTHNTIKDLISKFDKNFHLKYRAKNKYTLISIV